MDTGKSMSASVTPLLDFVRDMERHGVPPFRHDSHTGNLAADLRQAALDENAQAVVAVIHTTRLERLWRIEDWLMFRKQQHPKLVRWHNTQLVEIGWRAA